MKDFQKAILRIKALRDKIHKIRSKSRYLQKEKDKIIQLKEKILKLKNDNGLDLVILDLLYPEIDIIKNSLFELSKLNYTVSIEQSAGAHNTEIWIVKMKFIEPNTRKYLIPCVEDTIFIHQEDIAFGKKDLEKVR